MTAARAGIELSIEAGIDAIRAKSVALTEYVIELADTAVAPLGVSVDLPRDAAGRGSHVALVYPEARTLTAAFTARQVISDFRPPGVIPSGCRLCVAPSPTSSLAWEPCGRCCSNRRLTLPHKVR